MSRQELTLDRLVHILQDAAGVQEGVDLQGDILDMRFEDLGYDSLALLETASRITHAYGVPLADDVALSAETPRELIAIVNAG